MLTRRLEVSGWKRKELRISRQIELARWNMQLDEIGQIERGLAVR